MNSDNEELAYKTQKILDRMNTVRYELEQKGLFGLPNPKMEEYNNLGDELMKLIKYHELERIEKEINSKNIEMNYFKNKKNDIKLKLDELNSNESYSLTKSLNIIEESINKTRNDITNLEMDYIYKKLKN